MSSGPGNWLLWRARCIVRTVTAFGNNFAKLLFMRHGSSSRVCWWCKCCLLEDCTGFLEDNNNLSESECGNPSNFPHSLCSRYIQWAWPWILHLSPSSACGVFNPALIKSSEQPSCPATAACRYQELPEFPAVWHEMKLGLPLVSARSSPHGECRGWLAAHCSGSWHRTRLHECITNVQWFINVVVSNTLSLSGCNHSLKCTFQQRFESVKWFANYCMIWLACDMI